MLAKLPLIGKLNTLDKIFLGLMARAGRVGSLHKLRKHPDGILLEPNRPGDYLGQRVATPSGKMQLVPADLVERAARLDAFFQQDIEDRGRLKLIQKRERFSHNSWAHNVAEFVKGDRYTNYLYINPQDARTHGLSDGDTARVSANWHAIELPVREDENMSPGSVAVPHGWGHQSAQGLSTARCTTGVNVNIIMPDGPSSLELVSGISHMNGVVVDISRAVQQ